MGVAGVLVVAPRCDQCSDHTTLRPPL